MAHPDPSPNPNPSPSPNPNQVRALAPAWQRAQEINTDLVGLIDAYAVTFVNELDYSREAAATTAFSQAIFLYLPISPRISLYLGHHRLLSGQLPVSHYVSPVSPYISATTAFSQAISLYLRTSHPYLPISRRPPPSPFSQAMRERGLGSVTAPEVVPALSSTHVLTTKVRISNPNPNPNPDPNPDPNPNPNPNLNPNPNPNPKPNRNQVGRRRAALGLCGGGRASAVRRRAEPYPDPTPTPTLPYPYPYP